MASRGPGDASNRPEVGDTLLVIHDFQARSSDELTLTKGDRVELIERDDEFGDGWFLGRHLVNGNTGLFPEVYTRVAPKPAATPSAPPSATPFAPSKPLTPLAEVVQETPPVVGVANETPASQPDPTPEPPKANVVPQIEEPSPTLPLNSVKPVSTATPSSISSGSPAAALGRLNNESQDSQVLNDTLNVIDEHITDLRSPASNGALRAPTNDSGSEYSAPLDSRMSYIQGEETDEEEGAVHSRAEVEAWTPDDVAEYLFTNGVESHHCEVFRDQEISGEVLLGMDQSSLFIKDFDLGSVGRRLKTWHKIKSLQDDVSGHGLATRRTTQTYGSDVGSDDARRTRSRTNTGSISNRPISVQTRRLSMTQTPKASPTTLTSPASPRDISDSANLAGHTKRPSAASVRELHHSRRHSSTDFRNAMSAASPPTPKLTTNGTFPGAEGGAHKKQPSFDRNWTLGIAQRPLSSTGLQDIASASETDLQDSAVDLDRGYFSGTEADGRKRNVLRKRDSTSHSRKSSYAEEQRVRSATALSRHSRFGSVDSFRDGVTPSASQKYYGLQPGAHRRTASTNTTESVRPIPPAKDGPSPAVTKLDGDSSRKVSSPSSMKQHLGFNSDWLSSVVNRPLGKSSGSSTRATSDTLSNKNPVEPPPKDHPLPSPAPTGSSTPSGGPSFDLESPDLAKSPGMATANKGARRKGKKETSAYTRGLLNIGPKEAMAEAEYSGWMRKKSSNLMTTWKPRLFVLKGRRLAYYYSEDDTQEKGLIDISFHRVLPADGDKLTGLHATISGVVSHPTNLLPGSGGAESAEGLEKGDDSMFIFKLVPPRAGLSRAVNFTKPTVHYFAVPNLKQGRLWMAALMKATIDRDDSQPITTSYQQKTISLAKAKQMRHRPPALMNLDEASEDEQQAPEEKKDANGLGIFGEADSGVSGMDKLASQKVESAKLNIDFGEKDATPPTSA